MVETRRLKNVVISIQTILNFVLSRKILVTTDIVGISPCISHIEGLEFFANSIVSLPTEDIIKIAENFFKKLSLSLISSFSNKYVEPLLVLNLRFTLRNRK